MFCRRFTVSLQILCISKLYFLPYYCILISNKNSTGYWFSFLRKTKFNCFQWKWHILRLFQVPHFCTTYNNILSTLCAHEFSIKSALQRTCTSAMFIGVYLPDALHDEYSAASSPVAQARFSTFDEKLADFGTDPTLTCAWERSFLLPIDATKNLLWQVVTEGLGGVSCACYITEFIEKWWAWQGLNLWPLRCQRSALPLSYTPHTFFTCIIVAVCQRLGRWCAYTCTKPRRISSFFRDTDHRPRPITLCPWHRSHHSSGFLSQVRLWWLRCWWAQASILQCEWLI